MLPFAALSRRVVVAAVALGALAPGTEARKKNKKKKPSPTPLAFAALLPTSVVFDIQDDVPIFEWSFAGPLRHPETGRTFSFNDILRAPVGLTAEQTRERIVREAQSAASSGLDTQGIDVPPERVEVIVL